MEMNTGNGDERVPTEVMENTALVTFGAVLEPVECLAMNNPLTRAQLSTIYDRLVEPFDMIATSERCASFAMRPTRALQRAGGKPFAAPMPRTSRPA